jgi:putative two-component system response regulator
MTDHSSATILIVDDSPDNLRVLAELLKEEFRVLAATSGAAALTIANGPNKPDLILLDVVMEGMDGYAVFDSLKHGENTSDIPVIFLTSLNDPSDEEWGLLLGAADYILKPISRQVVTARVRAQVEIKQARDWLKNKNAVLEAEVARRMAENDITQQISIRALANLAEARDPETGNHILRTQEYVRRLALALQNHPRFAATLSNDYISLLVRSAPLHDLGKVGIPDAILRKPGPLTDEEWEVMKTHAALGSDALERAERSMNASVPFLKSAKEIARHHHERWDGSGYPDGLAGDAIPVSARLMAVADVFDALISRRVYKPDMDRAEVWERMESESGKHFDPDVLAVLLAAFDDFVEVAQHYSDQPVTA